MRVPAYPNLAAEIARRGLTQAELGEAVGITGNSVGNVIRGSIQPSKSLRARFAEVLEVPEDVLFELHPDIARLVDQAVAQGLGRVIEDPNVLRRVASLARGRDAQPA